jgi:hypothetical protein
MKTLYLKKVMAGFEPGSCTPEEDAMSTATRRHADHWDRCNVFLKKYFRQKNSAKKIGVFYSKQS